MITPSTLREGDKVAIISPASVVNPEYIDQAAEYLLANGLEPVVMPHAKGPAYGSFAANPLHRIVDFLNVWTDPDIKAVLCSRGGYGATHLLSLVPYGLLSDFPKWLIGFSDISALHALSLYNGVASIHGPMAKDFRDDHEGGRTVVEFLKTGVLPEYSFENKESDIMPCNIPGEARGTLIGGNLAVLNGLAATPYDMLARAMEEDCVLFIEDIAEPIYKIERILYRLLMQGVFTKLKGLAVGQFTESSADRNYPSTERMIERFLQEKGIKDIPVAYNLPVGHFPHNMPVIEGSQVRLSVSPEAAILTTSIAH